MAEIDGKISLGVQEEVLYDGTQVGVYRLHLPEKGPLLCTADQRKVTLQAANTVDLGGLRIVLHPTKDNAGGFLEYTRIA
jgi:hypothetical protein